MATDWHVVVVVGAGGHIRTTHGLASADRRQQPARVDQEGEGLPHRCVVPRSLLLVEADVPPGVGLVRVQLDVSVRLENGEVAGKNAYQSLDALIEKELCLVGLVAHFAHHHFADASV